MAADERVTSFFGRDAAGDFQPRERIRYFDGLFLRAAEFGLETMFHVAARRYMNFLLFNPGRLLDADVASVPLQLSHGPGAQEITISPGAALLRDSVRQQAYEVHLKDPETLNLGDPAYGFANGDSIRVSLTFGEADRDSGTGSASPGGAGVLVPGNDRTVEQAVIALTKSADPPPPAPAIEIGTVTLNAAIAAGDVTNTTSRGGLRYEILSDDLISRLAAPTPSTLTGITITPAGPLSVAVGGTLMLTAVGQFSSGPDRALTAADGLTWSISPPGIATVGATGLVTGVTAGAADVHATVGSTSTTSPLTVSPAAIMPVIDHTNVTAQASGGPVVIFGSNLRDPGLTTLPAPAAGTTVRIFKGALSLIVPAADILALGDSGGFQRIRFTMPSRDPSWAVNEAVTLEVGFGGGTASVPFAYDD